MTATVKAFVGEGPAVDGVLSMAKLLADLHSASVEAVHVGEKASPETLDAAHSAQVPLRVVPGDPIERIVEEMSAASVVAGVVGARQEPTGPRPVGSTALEVITRVDKLIAVVPPHAVVPSSGVGRILVPLDGTAASARAVEVLSETCARTGVEVLVLHVFDSETMPAFWDQPAHEAEAFGTEFLARFMANPDAEVRLRTGIPGESVLEAAVRETVDGIALGWSQSLDPGRAEVVRRVLSDAPVPVLLVASE
jgi:nucleotide-binding universal stress UspA family protein